MFMQNAMSHDVKTFANLNLEHIHTAQPKQTNALLVIFVHILFNNVTTSIELSKDGNIKLLICLKETMNPRK